MRYHNILLFITALACFTLTSAAAQVKPRIAGLETNSEYMELLRQEAALSVSLDSLSNELAAIRDNFRNDAGNRESYTSQILSTEKKIFEARKKMGSLASRINAIEQEYILKGFGDDPQDDPSPDTRQQFRDITDHPSFGGILPSGDLTAFRNHRSVTPGKISELIALYTSNVSALNELSDRYDIAANLTQADSIVNLFDSIYDTNERLAGQIRELSEAFTDQLIFGYTYFANQTRDRNLTSAISSGMRETRDRVSELREEGYVWQIASWPVRLKMLAGIEARIARTVNMSQAADSLKRLNYNEEKYKIRPVELAERDFIEYEDVVVGTRTIYTASNPIPPTVIWPKGNIYRVHLGIFARKQPVNIFRNVSPLSFFEEPDGRYSYYAGGFRTAGEAVEAVERLKKAGFRSPLAVKWTDGVITDRNVSESGSFRLEITMVGDLPEAVKSLVAGEGKDISRAGDKFIIGNFSTRAQAQDLLEDILEIEKGADIKITAL